MSNPFAAFRKNQKAWMAGLVLLAILAFVIAPAIDTAKSAFTGGGGGTATVVRWNGGKITVADLQNKATKHSGLVRFLNGIAREVIDAGGQPQVPGFGYNPQTQQIVGWGIQADSSEEDLCRTSILVAHGKKLGISFSDEAIDEFLRAYCDGKLPTERVAEILDETTGGNLSWFEARELLKEELTAMVVGQVARSGLYSQPPGKTFRDFMKLNQTAKVEAFPVLVDDYLSQVTSTPTDAEIQAIYDAGAARAANPNSSEPGFGRRYQANVEYVQANLKQWTDREKAKLTEEQLREEYDKRVELGQLQAPVQEAVTDTPADAEESDSAAAPASEAPAEETTRQEEEANSENTSGDQPSAGDQSQTKQLQKTRLVSFAQEADNTPPPVVQPPQLDEVAKDPADAQSTSGETPAAAEPEMRTQTFEEAKEAIADSLAQEAAIPAMREALTQILNDVMVPYYGAYREYEAFASSGLEKDEDGEVRQVPTKPDLKKVAESLGFVYSETGLLDGVKLSQLPFGLGNIQSEDPNTSGSVANVVMSPALGLFRPMQSNYFDQAALMDGRTPEFLQYLFWKTEDKQAYIPELDEVRDEVIDYWRRQQAQKLAEAEASSLAKKVGGATDPWSGALSETQKSLIVATDPFPWMSRFGEFTMTANVAKLDAVGGEFMQRVFTATPEQVVVAPNGNRSVFYVVRIADFNPSTDELQQRFNADPIKSGPMGIARDESNQLVMDWYQNLESSMGVEWQMNLGQMN